MQRLGRISLVQHLPNVLGSGAILSTHETEQFLKWHYNLCSLFIIFFLNKLSF